MRLRLSALLFAVALLAGCSKSASMDHLEVVLEPAPPLEVGQTQPLRVKIRNNGTTVATVLDIDVARTLLEGVDIASVRPHPSRNDLHLLDYRIYRMELEVPAQEERVVTFQLEGTEPGTYQGDIDVGVDFFHIKTLPATVEVSGGTASEAEASGPGGAADWVDDVRRALQPRRVSEPSAPPAAPSARGAGSPPDRTPPTADRRAPRR